MDTYGAVIHPRNGKGHPLFFYQVGKVCFLAGLFASGSEWTGLLLCSYTAQLLNECQVEGQSHSGRIKTQPRVFQRQMWQLCFDECAG